MDTILDTYIRKEILLSPILLNDEISDNNIFYKRRDEFEIIVEYVDDFLDGRTINRYLVLPGIRDVGKTTLLLQIYEYLLKEKNINSKNILYLSVNDIKKMSNKSIMDGVSTYLRIFFKTIIETLNEPLFLLIDETQYDEDWSLIGKIIFDNSKKNIHDF